MPDILITPKRNGDLVPTFCHAVLNLNNGALSQISPVLCSSRHQHQLVRRPLDEDHILLFSWGYESWRKRMLSLP
jgi:hypothetical protein